MKTKGDSAAAVIRVDASIQIGSGHLMRCLSLADALRRKDFEVRFLCRDLHGNLSDYVRTRGYPVHLLSAPTPGQKSQGSLAHSSWLEVSMEQEIDEVLTYLKHEDLFLKCLITDHYALDCEWENALRKKTERILVIDDLADRKHECDALVDQNLFEDYLTRYNGLVPENCKKLLGPAFALLRPEFAELRSNLRTRNGAVRRVLIFLGGSDPANETTKVLNAVEALRRRDLEIDVVLSSIAPHRREVEDKAKSMGNVKVHVNTDRMAALMANADLCIGAGGVTSWERCCLGLPSVVLTVAQNQELTTKTLADRKATYYLGRARDVTAPMITEALSGLLRDSVRLMELERNSREIVDGLGTERVVQEMTDLG